MIFPTVNSRLALVISVATLLCPLATNASVCTQKRDEYDGNAYELPGLDIPCPATGERVNAAFRYISPGAASASIQVSHQGDMSVDGISFAYDDTATFAVEQCDLKENWDDFFFRGEPAYTCRQGFGDGGVYLCKRVSHNTDLGSERTMVVSVWNNGGCEGNIEIRAYLSNILDPEAEVECVSGIEEVCPQVNGGDGGSYWDAAAFALELKEQNVCTKEDQDYFTAGDVQGYDQMYPELKVPCPAIGERINAAVTYRNPIAGTTQVSFAVSHDGPKPVVGISMARDDFTLESCEDLQQNFTDFFKTAELGKTLFCDAALSDKDRLLCLGGPTTGVAGEENTVAVSVWNDGGCEGNLLIQATVEDNYKKEIVCLSGIEQVCENVTGGTGGPFYNMTAAKNGGSGFSGSSQTGHATAVVQVGLLLIGLVMW